MVFGVLKKILNRALNFALWLGVPFYTIQYSFITVADRPLRK